MGIEFFAQTSDKYFNDIAVSIEILIVQMLCQLRLRYDLAAVLREHGRIEEALEQLNQIAQEEPGYRDVEMLVAELQS